MLKDAQGLDVSTDDPQTVAAIDRFVGQALAYGADLGCILPAAAAEPAGVMANALAASLMMWMESGESPRLARPYLEGAAAGLSRATPREALFHAATEAWVEGDVDRALGTLEELTTRWPRDVLAMKLAQYHYFNLGRFAELLAITERLLPANLENGYVHGCLAFGLEQMSRLREAEAAGRRAVAMNRADPWAHHAVAHVMETEGRLEEGVAWMEGHADTWVDCNSFMLGHNWWHTALYYLDMDRADQVLALYDHHVWGIDKSYSQDQVNAISLLWRLELRGVDVGDRWLDVAGHVATRGPEHVQPFLDLHYLYALGRAGMADRAATLLAGMAEHAAATKPFVRDSLRQVALPAAQAVLAYASGDYERAHPGFARAMPRLQEIGGSHAQRDLFVQTWLDVLLRTGRYGEARPWLERRAQARQSAPYAFRLLHRAYDGLGELRQAAIARDRTSELEGRYAV